MVDETEVRRIEVALSQAGWADHARLERALRIWERLAKEVNEYPATVDDYTNDVCSRDYVAEVTARASQGLRDAIAQRVAEADGLFRQGTVADTDECLARYYRVDLKDGWWWRRRPSAGPLADYLADD